MEIKENLSDVNIGDGIKAIAAIVKFLEKLEARSSQINKIKEFIDLKDELQAWQTIGSQIDLLSSNNIYLPHNQIEKLSNNICKEWSANGRIYRQFTCKDSRINGDYLQWYITNGYQTEKLEICAVIRNGHRSFGIYGGGFEEEYKKYNEHGDLIVFRKNGISQRIN